MSEYIFCFVLFDLIWFGLFTYWFGYLLFCFGFYILVCFSAMICFLIILVFVTRISFFRPVLLVCHKISDQQYFFLFPLKMKAKQTKTSMWRVYVLFLWQTKSYLLFFLLPVTFLWQNLDSRLKISICFCVRYLDQNPINCNSDATPHMAWMN